MGHQKGVRATPMMALDVEVEGVCLGICLSREQAYVRLEAQHIHPDEHELRRPGQTACEIAFDELTELYQKVAAFDFVDWPLTLRRFNVVREGAAFGYFNDEHGVLEEGVCFSKETARRHVEGWRKAHQERFFYDSDEDEEERRESAELTERLAKFDNYQEQVYAKVLAEIDASGLPEHETADDKRFREGRREADRAMFETFGAIFTGDRSKPRRPPEGTNVQ